MAAGNMKDIKNRIKSVESTMQITKAMELVASSKLRKAKQRAEESRPFFNKLYETVSEIAAQNKGMSSIYTDKREVKNSLFILVAGDRGLAGGYNINILKMAKQKAENKNVKFIAIGAKAIEFCLKNDYEIVGDYSDIAETFSITHANAVALEIIKLFKNGNVDEVSLFFTQFVSSLNQMPTLLQMLPLSFDNENTKTSSISISYDPSPEQVFNNIMPYYLSGLIYGGVVESFASEQGARRTAMESASDNAKDMISSLSLIYNRARQSAITQELSEIVGGAQALS